VQNGSGRFFITGGTLPPEASSYVPRQADDALLKHLREGEFCYVLTTRQMGKSSLMVRTATRLRAEGVSVVMLDLTAVGRNLTAEQWYGGLLLLLGEQLNLSDAVEAYWRSHAWLGPMQRWMEALDHIAFTLLTENLVIFVDEIDAVRGLAFSTDEFFAGIRACYNRRSANPSYRRLTFCLLGVASPSDLISDVDLSPFNIGHRIQLMDFTLQEAAPLAAGLNHREGREKSIPAGRQETKKPGNEEDENRKLLERVLYWTGGHPYMTQRLCRALAESLSSPSPSLVDALCERLFLSKAARDSDDNLAFVHNRLLRGDVDAASMLDLYGRIWSGKRIPDDETNPLHTVIHLSGIARLHAGVFEVRNRIYRQVFDRAWIRANMPDAELRRQQAAYRRGLVFAGTGAVIIVAIISVLALFSIQSAGRALRAEANAHAQKWLVENERDYSNRLLYDSNLVFAQQHVEAGDIEGARDLLEQSVPPPGKTDNRGFEWYYLNQLCHQDRLIPLGNLWNTHPIALSFDGKMLAAGEDRGIIQLFDTASKQPGIRLTSPQEQTSLAFSPDGRTLVAGTANHQIQVWNLQTGRLEHSLFGHTDRVTSVAFHPEGHLLASGSNDGTIRLWDTHTFRQVGILAAHVKRGVWKVIFSPDGKTLAAGCDDGTARLWNTADRQLKRILSGHTWYVYWLAFAPDGQTLATGSGDTTAILWDVKTGQARHVLRGHTSYVYAVAFSSDGKTLATGGWDKTIRLWDVNTGVQNRVFRDIEKIYALSYLQDGRTLVSTSPMPWLHLWDTRREPEEATLYAGTKRAQIRAVAFSPDGTWLAMGSRDHTAQLRNTKTRSLVRIFPLHRGEVNHIDFSSDSARIAITTYEGDVGVWEVATGRNLLDRPSTGRVARAFLRREGQNLLILNDGDQDGSIQEVDLATGQTTPRYQGHVSVNQCALSHDGTRLLIQQPDGRNRLWEVSTGKDVRTFDIGSSMAFSSDDRNVLMGGIDGSATVFDTASGRRQLVLKRHSEAINACAYSADDRRIVTGSQDQSVKIWDAATGRELMTLHTPNGSVFSVAISPQGDRIACGSYNGPATLWQVLATPK